MSNNRKTILGVPLDTYQQEEFLLKIEKDFRSANVKTIFAVNPEKIMRAQRDPELFSALEKADFLVPDGIGTVIGLRLIYGEIIARSTGIGLMRRLLDLADKKKYKVFIFGSKPWTNTIAKGNILKRFPSLNLVGTQHGYLPKEEDEVLIEKINSLGTDILFVGLGSPKQEKWIHRYKKFLRVKICMGIGGSLDVIAKIIPRAPIWLQNIGLEWLYRLMREPSRFKRQKVLPRFAFEVLKEKIF